MVNRTTLTFSIISALLASLSNVSGLTDEVYLAAIRASSCPDGFTVGDVYFGTGQPGVIARSSDGGATLTNPWVTLPGETGLLRGGLQQDRACVAGGDLIVTTTAGDVWRVNAAGTAKELASNFGGRELEGPVTVPSDPARYGPWSGQILAADEKNNVVWSIDPTTGKTTRSDVAGGATFAGAEGVLVVPPNENFFGVDYGDSTLQAAPASQFADVVGDVIVATETEGKLFDVKWNGTSFVTTDLLSNDVSRWEGTTFAPSNPPDGGVVPGEGGCVAKLTAPTQLSSAPGEKSATVSWAPVTSDPPGCLEEYVVTPHGSGVPVHSMGPGTTTVVSGLTNGTKVTFTVAAANGGGLGPQSAPTTPITIGAPAAPGVAQSVEGRPRLPQGGVRSSTRQRVGDQEIQGRMSIAKRRYHARRDRDGKPSRRQTPHEGQDLHVHGDRDERLGKQSTIGTVTTRQGLND